MACRLPCYHFIQKWHIDHIFVSECARSLKMALESYGSVYSSSEQDSAAVIVLSSNKDSYIVSNKVYKVRR